MQQKSHQGQVPARLFWGSRKHYPLTTATLPTCFVAQVDIPRQEYARLHSAHNSRETNSEWRFHTSNAAIPCQPPPQSRSTTRFVNPAPEDGVGSRWGMPRESQPLLNLDSTNSHRLALVISKPMESEYTWQNTPFTKSPNKSAPDEHPEPLDSA